jgi:hypothetical protein
MMLANINSPPPPAYRADPYTVDEIDAHPDSARIWATIIAMRFAHEQAKDEAYEQGVKDGSAAT